MSDLETQLEIELRRCNKCGFCMGGCPVYQVTGLEYDTARGRIALIQEALNGRLDMAKDIGDALDTCILCRGCIVYCPGHVNTDEIVRLARAVRQTKQHLSLPYRVAFRNILPSSRRLNLTARAFRVLQRSGLGKGNGVRRVFPFMAKAADIIPDLPRRSARTGLEAKYSAVGKYYGKVAYFLGCGINTMYPRVALATIGILTLNGWDVVVPAVNCCGLPAAAAGDLKSMVNMAKKNIKVLATLGVDAIVTDCPSCASTIMEYSAYLRNDPLSAEATMVSCKVREISQFFNSNRLVSPTNEVAIRATYHHPCHLGRYLNVTPEVPRQIIKSIPGLQFVDSAKSTDCCGGGGSYCLNQVERSQFIVMEKMRAFIASDADSIITCCPACMMQLQYGVKISKSTLQVLHVSEVLAASYGLEIS